MWDEILQLLQEEKFDLLSRIDFVTCIGYPYEGKHFSAAA